jgi:hypothetical protein
MHYQGNRALLSPLFASYHSPPNSDYFPYLAMHAPRSMYSQETAENFVMMKAAPFPELPGSRPASLSISTPVTPDPHFFISQGILATHYYTDFMQGKPLTLAVLEQHPVIQAITRLRTALNSCTTRQPDPEQMMQDLHSVAIQLKTEGNRNDIDRAWRVLLSSPCLADLPEEVQLWARLYHAVGAARFEQMLEIARRLLVNYPVQDNRKQYLLAAALTGALGSHQLDAGRQLWRQHGQGRDPNDVEQLYLRLLLLHLQQE